MRLEFCDVNGRLRGTVTLDGGGAVVFPPNPLGENIRATNVVCPGPTPVTPADGELYLRALPYTFRSPYLTAVFVG
jgi:hypothetical protein